MKRMKDSTHEDEDKLCLFDLWDGEHWDWSKLSFFLPDHIHPNSSIGNRDTLYWACNSNGIFTTKLVHVSLTTPAASKYDFAWI